MDKLQASETGQISRRDALARVAGVGLGIASVLGSEIPRASAQAGVPPMVSSPMDRSFPLPPSWKTELKKLAPNVYAYIQSGGPGQHDGRGISNAGIVVGEDHILVIDALGAPLHTKGMIDAVRTTVGNKPFGRVINTHHHGDHTNGNQFLGPAEFVSHPFCRDMVVKMNPPPVWEKREGWALGTEKRKVVAPTTCFTDRMTYHYGDTIVELIHPGVAHTWGDVMVYLPREKVLFAGDIASHYITPFAHNGQVTSWIEIVGKTMEMDIDYVVPGHGALGGKKEFAETGEYFTLLKREVRKRFDAGMSPGKAAADIRLGKFDNWMGSERVMLNTFRLYTEFNETLTPVIDIPALTQAIDEYNAIMKARTPAARRLDYSDFVEGV